LFPIAWADDVDGLLPHWVAAGRPLVIVHGLGPAHTRALAAAGVPMCATVPPTRGERWARLPGPARVWVTDGSAVPGLDLDLGYLTGALDRQRADAAARVAVPGDESGPLERTVTLAAGLGLTTIAWMLWRDREPTDAPLTVERFGDLSAAVTFSPDGVHVRVPLGRRHADLYHRGLLADVPDAFWLGGRTLSFSGG
jgi:hypothetical protein